MNEGWYSDEYLVIFSQAESQAASANYHLDRRLPGYVLVGLRSWDDFILVSPIGAVLSLPTLPLEASRAEEFSLPDAISLQPDARFAGRVKWYVKPLIFGGEPSAENTSWVTHEQHAQLVSWWNEKYDSLET